MSTTIRLAPEIAAAAARARQGWSASTRRRRMTSGRVPARLRRVRDPVFARTPHLDDDEDEDDPMSDLVRRLLEDR
jgi:hypothetical protein